MGTEGIGAPEMAEPAWREEEGIPHLGSESHACGSAGGGHGGWRRVMEGLVKQADALGQGRKLKALFCKNSKHQDGEEQLEVT